jgi:hypothetical protein
MGGLHPATTILPWSPDQRAFEFSFGTDWEGNRNSARAKQVCNHINTLLKISADFCPSC